MPKIYLEQWPQPIEARKLRILEAALDAGVPFPHSCGAGECGSCKCRLLEGEVKHDRHSPDALSDEEYEQGMILACRARPLTDVMVKWLAESAAPTAMVKLDAEVGRIEAASPDVLLLTVQLRPDQRFPFRPGQFAKLRVGPLPARSYSMANQPGMQELVFHVRVRPDGRVSQYMAHELEVGDPVEVRGPFGEAYWQGRDAWNALISRRADWATAQTLHPDDPRVAAADANVAARHGHLLLVAGGTGLAPILSVLDAALADGHDPRMIDLYHGVRTTADLYAGTWLVRRAHLQGFRFVPVFAESGPGRIGLLHQVLGEDFDGLTSSLIHVAGPPPMVEAVRALAEQRGAAAALIRADAFHPSQPEKRSLWERITAWGVE